MNLPEAVSNRRIGALFVERGLVSESQLIVALELQQETGQQLGQILVERFGVQRAELAKVVAEHWARMGQGEDAANTRASESWRQLGEILVSRGFVTREQLTQALDRQRQTGERLGEALVGQGILSKFELAGSLAEQASTVDAPNEAESEPAPVVPLAPWLAKPDEPADLQTPTRPPWAITPSWGAENSESGDATEEEAPSSAEQEPGEPASEQETVEHERIEQQAVEHGPGEPDPLEQQAVEQQAVRLEAVEQDPAEPDSLEQQAAEQQQVELEAVEQEAVEQEAGGTLVGEPVEPIGPERVETPEPVAGTSADEAPATGHGRPEQVAVDTFVAFASTPRGYRLVALDVGAAPEVGERIELPELGELVVMRRGASPLPLDERVCVFLERPVPAAHAG